MFEVVGVLEVDDRSVVNEESGAPFGGSAPEVFLVLAFEGGDFVFDATGGGDAVGLDEIAPSFAIFEHALGGQ